MMLDLCLKGVAVPDISVFADVALCDHHNALHTVARSQSHLQAPGTTLNINAGVKGRLDLCHAAGALPFGTRNKLRCVGSKILKGFFNICRLPAQPPASTQGSKAYWTCASLARCPGPGLMACLPIAWWKLSAWPRAARAFGAWSNLLCMASKPAR